MSQQRFRIAIRHEGELINAYFAPAQTMDGAVLVASIRTRTCQLEGVFDAFKQLTATIGRALAEQVAGVEVEAVLFKPAPEHERAGHG